VIAGAVVNNDASTAKFIANCDAQSSCGSGAKVKKQPPVETVERCLFLSCTAATLIFQRFSRLFDVAARGL
jgi:hypothetical protein